MENLSTLNNFFDGRDESWFYLITVEIEARGAPAIVPMLLAMDAISRSLDEDLNCSVDEGEVPVQWRRDDVSRSNSFVEDIEILDERLLLPGGAFIHDPSRERVKSNCVSGSRRKRTAQPGDRIREGRYLLSSLSSSRDLTPLPPRREPEKFPPNEALVGDLSTNRVAEFVSSQLERVASAVHGMCLSLETMREGCHPFIFYHRVRPFLSAWKQVRI
jgi:Indoleamine 2,3-dioxygenase